MVKIVLDQNLIGGGSKCCLKEENVPCVVLGRSDHPLGPQSASYVKKRTYDAAKENDAIMLRF